jgi:hypothetical protein
VRRDSQKEAKHWCDHQYYLAHKDKKAEYRRKWAKANPDKIRASKRRYREHHRDNMAEEDQSRRWLQKDRVAEWSKRWYETHREEIRERDRQKTRLKKLIPYLYERGVLNGDDLFAIQCQRKSRLPISETISYVKERNRTAQEAWNRDEVAEVTHERRTFKMFLSHLHEAGALDDNDLRIITHQRKAHLRRYETISYVGERIRMAPQSRNGPGSQQSENVPDDSFGENREEHISALLAPFKEEGAEEQPYPGDQDVERHDDDTLRGL